MLSVLNDDITLTRGDTANLGLNIKKSDGSAYDFTNDTVVFTVKTSTNTTDIVFQKHFSDGQITINPEDTQSLKYATYKYDVQITTELGEVFTVIAPHNFIVAMEVTF